MCQQKTNIHFSCLSKNPYFDQTRLWYASLTSKVPLSRGIKNTICPRIENDLMRQPFYRCHQEHEQWCIRPTSCCPSGAHHLSTTKLWPWGKHGADTLRPPHPLSGLLWTSSRVAGWSQVGRLRNTSLLRPFVLLFGWATAVHQQKMSSA